MPTTPPTFVAGDILEADQLNQLGDGITELQAIAEGVTFSGCKLRRAASQSLSNNTDTNISFDTETFDYGGWYTSGTNVVVPSGAIPAGFTTIAVLVVAAIKYASNATGKRKVAVQLNGATAPGGSWTIGALSGDVTDVLVTTVFTVVAADVITLVGLQTSGGALNATEGALSVTRYAPVA